jgi:hypothetical protein
MFVAVSQPHITVAETRTIVASDRLAHSMPDQWGDQEEGRVINRGKMYKQEDEKNEKC